MNILDSCINIANSLMADEGRAVVVLAQIVTIEEPRRCWNAEQHAAVVRVVDAAPIICVVDGAVRRVASVIVGDAIDDNLVPTIVRRYWHTWALASGVSLLLHCPFLAAALLLGGAAHSVSTMFLRCPLLAAALLLFGSAALLLGTTLLLGATLLLVATLLLGTMLCCSSLLLLLCRSPCHSTMVILLFKPRLAFPRRAA